jgi:N-methylhydantoinase A/oxoprolinase/acetone carboxylase beta subunit
LPPLVRRISSAAFKRRVWMDRRWRQVPVLTRQEAPRTNQKGPFLVLDYGATTLVPEGWMLRLDAAGNLIITR